MGDPASRNTGVSSSTRRVSIKGDSPSDTALRLRELLAVLCSRPAMPRLVIDLSAAAAIDGDGLGQLVILHAALREQGGGLVITGCSESIRRALEATHLNRLLSIQC